MKRLIYLFLAVPLSVSGVYESDTCSFCKEPINQTQRSASAELLHHHDACWVKKAREVQKKIDPLNAKKNTHCSDEISEPCAQVDAEIQTLG